MEYNFFVGVVCHRKRMSKELVREKVVLYTSDGTVFVDLINMKEYTTDNSLREYVEEDSLINTDISLYKVNYRYLVSRYYDNINTRGKVLFRKQ